MVAFRNALFVLCGLVLVAAQSTAPTPTTSSIVLPESTAGLDPCMEDCYELAATANNCAIDDVNCACASSQLQADLTQCLDTKCSAFAAPQAQGLLIQLCNKVAVVATGSALPNHLTINAAAPSATPAETPGNGLPALPTGSAPARIVCSAVWSTVLLSGVVVVVLAGS